MPIKNKIKSFVDDRGMTVYRFRDEVGIANGTAYGLYNRPHQYPSKEVVAKICKVYGVHPGDLLEYVE